MQLVIGWPRLMRPDVAAEYVGGETMFDRLLEKGLAPKVRQNRMTLYDRAEVDAAVDRFEGDAD